MQSLAICSAILKLFTKKTHLHIVRMLKMLPTVYCFQIVMDNYFLSSVQLVKTSEINLWKPTQRTKSEKRNVVVINFWQCLVFISCGYSIVLQSRMFCSFDPSFRLVMRSNGSTFVTRNMKKTLIATKEHPSLVSSVATQHHSQALGQSLYGKCSFGNPSPKPLVRKPNLLPMQPGSKNVP